MLSASLSKPSQQIALSITEFGWHCNHNLRTQVSSTSVTTTLIEMRHTSTLEQKLATLLHARWNYQIFITIKGAQHQVGSKCCLSNRDHNINHEIVFFASIGVVLGDAHMHIQISCATTTYTHCTTPTYAKCLAGVDAGRNFHGVFNIFDNATVAPARRTRRVNYLAHSAASTAWRRSHHLAKHALTDSTHLPSATALRTSLCRCSLFGSASRTFVAANCRAHLHSCRATKHCFFK
jgi:hypothetical protein